MEVHVTLEGMSTSACNHYDPFIIYRAPPSLKVASILFCLFCMHKFLLLAVSTPEYLNCFQSGFADYTEYFPCCGQLKKTI